MGKLKDYPVSTDLAADDLIPGTRNADGATVNWKYSTLRDAIRAATTGWMAATAGNLANPSESANRIFAADSTGFGFYTLAQLLAYFGGGSYTLPIATAEVLGGVRVGAGLSIDPDTGILTATGGGGKPKATENMSVACVPDEKTMAQAFAELDAYDFSDGYTGTITIPAGYVFGANDQLLKNYRPDTGWLRIVSDQFPTPHTCSAAPAVPDPLTGSRALVQFRFCSYGDFVFSVDMSSLGGVAMPLSLIGCDGFSIGDVSTLTPAELIGSAGGVVYGALFNGGNAFIAMLKAKAVVAAGLFSGALVIDSAAYASCSHNLTDVAGAVTITGCDEGKYVVNNTPVSLCPTGATSIYLVGANPSVSITGVGTYWGKAGQFVEIWPTVSTARVAFSGGTYQPQTPNDKLLYVDYGGTRIVVTGSPAVNTSVTGGAAGYIAWTNQSSVTVEGTESLSYNWPAGAAAVEKYAGFGINQRVSAHNNVVYDTSFVQEVPNLGDLAAQDATLYPEGYRVRVAPSGGYTYTTFVCKNGAWWVDNGSITLVQQGAPASVTGTTVIQPVIFAPAIPAGFMRGNSQLRVRGTFTASNTANAKTARLSIITDGGEFVFWEHDLANKTLAPFDVIIQNKGVLTSQFARDLSNLGFSDNTNAAVTLAADTTGAVSLFGTVQLDDAGDTVTLEHCTVEFVQGG